MHSKGLQGFFQVDECRQDRVKVGRWRIEKWPILAAILDAGERIAKPTSGMVLQPLIIHTKWY